MREVSGTWHNEHGSQMTIEVDDEGRLWGSFRSGVGLAPNGERFDVTGFASGGLIAFSVDFSRYDTVTSFAGHYLIEEGRPVIRAMWLMSSSPGSAAQGEGWKCTWTGSDTFQREPPREPRRQRIPSHPVDFSDFEPV